MRERLVFVFGVSAPKVITAISLGFQGWFAFRSIWPVFFRWFTPDFFFFEFWGRLLLIFLIYYRHEAMWHFPVVVSSESFEDSTVSSNRHGLLTVMSCCFFKCIMRELVFLSLFSTWDANLAMFLRDSGNSLLLTKYENLIVRHKMKRIRKRFIPTFDGITEQAYPDGGKHSIRRQVARELDNLQ